MQKRLTGVQTIHAHRLAATGPGDLEKPGAALVLRPVFGWYHVDPLNLRIVAPRPDDALA